MAYTDFDRLRAFFSALGKSHYHPERLDPKIITLEDQALCLNLIRERNPDLKGKSDKEIINNYLRNPKEVNRILTNFAANERAELQKALAEKPAATEGVSEQPTGQGTIPSTGQAVQPPVAGGGSVGGMPGMPSAPSVFSNPRQVVIQQATAPDGGMEGGPGQGTAATTKGSLPIAEKVQYPSVAPLQTAGSVTSANSASPKLNSPAFKSFFPSGFSKIQNLAAPAGIFFQRNAGKFLTIDRIAPLVSGGIGAIAGGAMTGGNPVGILGGGGLGALTPSWVRNGGGKTLGSIGNGALNAGVKLSNRMSDTAGKLSSSATSNKFGFVLIGLLLFVAFAAVFISSSTPTGEAAPVPTGSADISTCKFTRGAETPPDASIKSSTLISYIQEAAQKANIPPVVLAAFIRVESAAASNMSNDEIANYSAKCSVSPTGALGIMQIQPPGTTSLKGDPASCDDCIDAGAKLVGKTVATMTRADYCDPRTSIIIGAGWILKKMSKSGYGDGTKWDPAWTNDRKAIEALVNTYYGGLLYPDDNTGPFNYATDVTNSINNCKTTSVPPPPADGNYQKWLEGIGIKMTDGFPPEVYKWAYDILYQTISNFPKFKDLIHQDCPTITLSPTSDISHAETCEIPLSYGSGDRFFKFLIIHELAHKINKVSWIYNSQIIEARAADRPDDTVERNGFLTYYSSHAASALDKICGPGDDNDNRADEEFADSVAYYINSSVEEMNMHSADDYKGKCGVKWTNNPFQGGNRYKAHYYLINGILKSP